MTVTDRIEINPFVMAGKPVIRGTRIPLELLVRRLAEGATHQVLLDAYPALTEPDLQMSDELLGVFRRFDLAKVSIFGSALRPDFRPDSDVDLLVEFQPAARVGFLRLARLRSALEHVFGRRIDVIPATGLKKSLRHGIEESAKVLYAA